MGKNANKTKRLRAFELCQFCIWR